MTRIRTARDQKKIKAGGGDTEARTTPNDDDGDGDGDEWVDGWMKLGIRMKSKSAIGLQRSCT